MRLPSLISLIGFITLIAGTYSPLLRPLGLISFNMYELSKPYGIVVLLVAVIGMIGVVFNQLKIAKIAGWASLVLVSLFYLAVYLKVNASFSFVPFNSIAKVLAGKFRWGWYVLFAGSVLASAVSFTRKRQTVVV
ncbi:hypothetical protein DJ568_05425 [Mucilaginibacter hurinus]|uniref:DUF4293 domain-containing protein n=1 Tax=Mucilaginibacter hurinus TaxID=2201324 RepID=A0A367GSF9_9SPHI|nr:hypothetical protein [Mucilaginibacter hurinus]RCH56180.1 hypothetical protein DJ568_05425 [Mucilaginibacter hurinus]